MKYQKGSITLFFCLILLLVTSLVFSLLESARIQGLKTYVKITSINAGESLAGEYEATLFKAYGLFGLDSGFGSEDIRISEMNAAYQDNIQRNLRPLKENIIQESVNFYQMNLTDCSVTEYELYTDQKGLVFSQAVTALMKENWPVEAAAILKERWSEGAASEVQNQNMDQYMENASDQLEQAREAQRQAQEAAGNQEKLKKTGSGTVELPEKQNTTEVENPMDVVKGKKPGDLLGAVLTDNTAVSGKKVENHSSLKQRQKNIGNSTHAVKHHWYSKILLLQYGKEHFSCFTEKNLPEAGSKTKALDYEIEYLLSGSLTDEENLRDCVKKLLAIREAANFFYLNTDSVKKEEAYSVALSLATAAGAPSLAWVIQQGILAAWAYGESLMDVRQLLAGGKISWMKNKEEWTSTLGGLGGILTGSQKAKEAAGGADYEEYLQKLLFLKTEETLSFGMMDLMEMNLSIGRTVPLEMDRVMLGWKAELVYQAKPLFLSLVTIQRFQGEYGSFYTTSDYSYIKDEISR